MIFLLDSIKSAILLVISFDPEVFSVVLVSLKLSSSSTLIASTIGTLLGFYIAFESFPGKRMVITCLNTLLSLPTVVIGLFVYAFIARRGLLGHLGLLYTQKAIIIGQTILIIPLITTLIIAAISRIDERYRKTAMTLGANRWQTAMVVLREARFGIVAALIAAYGRVISEVGISMMLGGNAKGFTRTITTAMALEYDKGQFILALALGMILLGFSFTINLLFHGLQGRART
jgi:tungstate transport system permease protein